MQHVPGIGQTVSLPPDIESRDLGLKILFQPEETDDIDYECVHPAKRT